MAALHIAIEANKSSEAGGMLVHSHVAYKLELRNGQLQGYLNSGAKRGMLRFAVSDPVPVGQWGKYELLWNGSTIQVLINNEPVFAQDYSPAHLDERNSWILHIGKNPWGDAFDGAIDNLLIEIPGEAGENQAPLAKAGEDQQIHLESGDDGIEVYLNGTTSTDPDGELVSFDWFIDQELVASGPNASIFLPLGSHIIELRVTDDGGAMASDTVSINIIPPEDEVEANVLLSMNFNGHLNDASSHAHQVSWHGEPAYLPDIDGPSAIALSPTDDNYLLVERAPIFRGMEALHISIKANKASVAGGVLVHSHVAYKLELANGKVKGYLNGPPLGSFRFETEDPVPVGEWGQYELSWDGQTVQIHINGKLQFKKGFAPDHLDERTWWALHIGKYPWGDAFDGAIDELLIKIQTTEDD